MQMHMEENMGKLETENKVVVQEKSAQETTGDPLEQTNGSAPGSLGACAPTTRLYRRRWLMLLLFCTITLSNAYQWIQYSIISDIVMKFYMVEAVAVDMIAMIYMIVYVALIVPGSWLLDKKGMRATLLCASLFNCAGPWVKVASARPDLYWVAVLGQVLCAVAQVLILGVPPRLAAVWFGENEVSSACSIGVLGNQMGCAIGFLVPPMLVPNVGDVVELGYHIRLMFYITAGVATTLLIVMVMAFEDKPPTPPTQAQAKHELSEGGSYAASLLRLLRNRPFMLLVLSYGILVGASYTISTLLNRLITSYYPGEDENAGRIGLTFILTGIGSSLLCGVWLDRTKAFKQTTFAMYLLTLVGMLLFTFTLSLGHLWLVFITTGILGFFMFGYLPLGFEYGVELTYPEAEGTSSGLLNCSAQMFGIIFTFSEGKVIDRWGVLAGNIFLCCFLLIGVTVTGLIKSDLRRQKANLENCPMTVNAKLHDLNVRHLKNDLRGEFRTAVAASCDSCIHTLSYRSQALQPASRAQDYAATGWHDSWR